MTVPRKIRNLRTDLRSQATWHEEQGYKDGKAGRPVASPDNERYMQGYKRGLKKFEQGLGGSS